MSFTQPVQRRSSTKLRSMRLGYYFCGDCRQDTEGQAFFGERRPHFALAGPVVDGGDGTDVLLANRIVAPERARQEQERFLNVGRQVEQIHDLRDPRPGHAAEARQVRIVPHVAEAQGTASGLGPNNRPEADRLGDGSSSRTSSGGRRRKRRSRTRRPTRRQSRGSPRVVLPPVHAM